MSYVILTHRVAVKPFEVDEWDEDRRKAKSLGFALPDLENTQRAKASVDVGTVAQIGPDVELPVKEGDVVAYVKNAGKFILNPITKEEIYVLNDDDLLAILKE